MGSKEPKRLDSDYNSRYPDICPQEILTPYHSKENLNKWLSTFAVETRKESHILLKRSTHFYVEYYMKCAIRIPIILIF